MGEKGNDQRSDRGDIRREVSGGDRSKEITSKKNQEKGDDNLRHPKKEGVKPLSSARTRTRSHLGGRTETRRGLRSKNPRKKKLSGTEGDRSPAGFRTRTRRGVFYKISGPGDKEKRATPN